MYELERIEAGDGYKILVYQDEDAGSPAGWDNVGELTLTRSREYAELEETLGEEYIGRTFATAVRHFGLAGRGDFRAALPVHLQDYGAHGARLEYRADDDEIGAGDGFLVATAHSVEQTLGADASREQILEALEQEQRVWNNYLAGEVYGYLLESPAGARFGGCWDYYPDESTPEDPHGWRNMLADAGAELEIEQQARAEAAAADIATVAP